MTDLLTLQREFSQHLFTKSDKKILSKLIHSDIEALERLNIYRNNVVGNFEAILSDIFQVNKKIIGEKEFVELIKKYCQKFPSKSGDLNEFGIEFPKFIKSLKPLYLKDLAQLELLHHQAYFLAKSPQEFDLNKFKNLPSEKISDLIFTMDSSAILFASKFSIFSIWQKEKNIKNFAKPQFMMLHANKIFLLSEEEYLFLTEIKQKKPLYKIYQKLCKKFGEEINIGALFNRFIADAIIVKFEV